MNTNWTWGWLWWNGRVELDVFLDLQDWGLTLAAGWRNSAFTFRAQVGPFEVHFDVDFQGYVEDVDFED